MRRSRTAVGVLAGALLLAGCTSNSGGTATSTSSQVSTSLVAAGSSMSVSTPPESGAPGSTSPVSTAPASSAAYSTAPVSSAQGSAAASPSSAPVSSPVSSAAAVLDPASTRWLTTYCTTIGPVTRVTGLQSQISAASGDLTKIKALFVLAFRTSGAAMTATATALKGQPAPALTAAGSDLPGLLSRIGTLGAQLTRDGATLEAIDPVARSAALGTALSTYGPDIDKIATVVGTRGGLRLPAAALPEIGRIAACNRVITTE